MSYVTGTVLQSATPAISMRDVLESAMTAHGNWEFVKTLQSGGLDYRVWKNRGVGNGFGSDWYLFLVYSTTGTGNVSYFCAENFNSSTNVFNHPCPLETTASTAPAADFSFGGATTYAFTTYLTNAHVETLTLSTTQFDYFIKVCKGHVMINIRVGSTTNGIYVGLFDTFMVSDPFPLVICNPGNTSASAVPLPGTTSRMPEVTTSVARQFAIREIATINNTGWTQAAVIYGGSVGLPGSTSGDLFAGGSPLGSRILVTPLNFSSPGLYGAIRGLYRDCLYFNTPQAVQPGDTMEIGTDTYVLTGALPSTSLYGLWMNTEAP